METVSKQLQEGVRLLVSEVLPVSHGLFELGEWLGIFPDSTRDPPSAQHF